MGKKWSIEVKIGLNGNEVGIDYLLIRKLILFLRTVSSFFSMVFSYFMVLCFQQHGYYLAQR